MPKLNGISNVALEKIELSFSQETAGPRAPCAPTQFIWRFVWSKEQNKNISLKGINSVASNMEITMFYKMKKWYLAPCKWAKAAYFHLMLEAEPFASSTNKRGLM